jgi:hypothetical protein
LPAKQVAQVKTVLSADSKNKGVHKFTTGTDISLKTGCLPEQVLSAASSASKVSWQFLNRQ